MVWWFDWLEKFTLADAIREMRIRGEAEDIPQMTIQSWIKCLSKITTDHELEYIWNLDELGLFFKALSGKSHVQK